MATIDLGKIKLVNRGAYNNSTAYTVDDLVQSGGTTYICIQNSTGNAVTNASYWSVLAAAGTNGTDVGTTITTQGDLLYRDGSGLARLGAGTSGYYLETKGSGQNPVWSEVVSGGLVKLGTTTLGSDASAMIMDNVFSTTYNCYRLNVINYRGTGANSQPRMLWRTGSSDISESWSSVYQYHYGNFNGSSGTEGGVQKYYSSTGGYIGNTWSYGDGVSTLFTCDIKLFNSFRPIVHGISSGQQDNSAEASHWYEGFSLMSTNNPTLGSTHTGFKIYATNGSIKAGTKMVLYGCTQ